MGEAVKRACGSGGRVRAAVTPRKAFLGAVTLQASDAARGVHSPTLAKPFRRCAERAEGAPAPARNLEEVSLNHQTSQLLAASNCCARFGARNEQGSSFRVTPW